MCYSKELRNILCINNHLLHFTETYLCFSARVSEVRLMNLLSNCLQLFLAQDLANMNIQRYEPM